MAVSFNAIPADLRVPLFYAEVDNSQASYFSQQQRALLVGQMLATGTTASGTPILVGSAEQAPAWSSCTGATTTWASCGASRSPIRRLGSRRPGP
jgi:phage tail sheath gpL-like